MEWHKVVVAEMSRLAARANRARSLGQGWLAEWYEARVVALRGELLRAYLAQRGRAA